MPILKDVATVAFCDAQSTSEIHEKVTGYRYRQRCVEVRPGQRTNPVRCVVGCLNCAQDTLQGRAPDLDTVKSRLAIIYLVPVPVLVRY